MRLMVAFGLLAVSSCAQPALIPVPREERWIADGKTRNEMVASCFAANPDAEPAKQKNLCECIADGMETYATKDEWGRMIFTAATVPNLTAGRMVTEVPKMLAVRRYCDART